MVIVEVLQKLNYGIWDLRYVSKTWIWFCGWLNIWVSPFLERALDALLVQEQTYMEWSFTLKCLLSFNTEILLRLDFITNFSWIVSDDMTESPCLQVQKSDRNSWVRVLQKRFCLKLGGDCCLCSTFIYTHCWELDQFKWERCKCTRFDDDGDDLILHDTYKVMMTRVISCLSCLHFLLLDLTQSLPSMFKLECSWCKFNNVALGCFLYAQFFVIFTCVICH